MVSQGNSQDTAWLPPKRWTAWPLEHKHVVGNRLVGNYHDEDDGFTFRRAEQTLPSTELEEELAATILRTAKTRFTRSMGKVPTQSVEQTDDGEHDVAAGRWSRETSTRPGTEDDEDKDGDEEMHDAGQPRPAKTRQTSSKTYKAVVSADDDTSYALLRPSVRHILLQLDGTLSILRNARLAGLNHQSDSSTDDESDSHQSTTTTKARQKRPPGRPKSSPRPSPPPGPETPKTPSRRGRGRPRKVHTPREGESHEDMLLRVARQGHRRLPTTPTERDAAFEDWLQRSDDVIERERSLSQARSRNRSQDASWGGAASESEASSTGAGPARKLSRWALRDWSDVVGAAALAGFPAAVVSRTAKRCADLFGESIVVRKLNEAPLSKGCPSTAFETIYHRPSPIRLSPSSQDSDADESDLESNTAADLVQRRVASRQASLARSSPSSPAPRGRLSRTQSPAAPRSSRSRSRSSAAGSVVFYCPVSRCDRAAQGFSRRANLRRHVDLVHGGRQVDNDVDSDDEVVGAVHVDGFLRPIVPGRGWRGEDAVTRKRKRYYGRESKGEEA